MTTLKDLLRDFATEVAGIVNPPEGAVFPLMPSKEEMISNLLDEYVDTICKRLIGKE